MRRFASVLLLAACAVAGCSGEEDKQGAENLLDKAFSQQIRSGDLKLNAEIDLDGLLDDPIRIEAEGPFHTNEGTLLSADVELRVGSGGGGQTITSGVLTTGDRVFVKFQDVYYEQPQAQVRRLNARILEERPQRPAAGRAGARPALLAGGGQGRGRRRRGGRQGMARLRHARRREPDAQPQQVRAPVLGGARRLRRRRRAALTRADIRALADAVDNPSFDVYAGKQDNLIRRISARIEFQIPEQSRGGLGGLKGGSIVFSVELSDVNGDKRIEAPARSQPLSKLTDSLGGGGVRRPRRAGGGTGA